MRVVVAPDSFKSVLDSRAAAEAIADGVRRAHPEATIDVVPMSDGGEGALACLLDAAGGNRRQVEAHDPLGNPIVAPVGLIRDATTAVIELAAVAGISLVPPDRRDPLATTTFGVGELIRAACETGVDQVILTVGDSATVDGGIGMMQALGLAQFDDAGRVLPEPVGGGRLSSIRRIEWRDPPENIDEVRYTVAHDVLNPACGPDGAAEVFGPQKGADSEAVRTLARGLADWADVLQRVTGRDIRFEPGTGAAGGVAMPLLALLNAEMIPGVDLLCQENDLASRIAEADLVITGEGRLDAQSLMGKVVGSVARMARAADVACVALVGTTGPGADRCLELLDRVVVLGGSIEETRRALSIRAEQTASALL